MNDKFSFAPFRFGAPQLLFFVMAVVLSLPANASKDYWSDIANNIIRHVNDAQSFYANGDSKAAKRAIIQAYFGEFEDKKMEAAMRMELGAKHTYQVERLFSGMRKAINKGAEKISVTEAAIVIRKVITRDARLLDKAGIAPEVFKVNQ